MIVINKTITIYELLGLVKDGKQPNHIVFDTDDWYWGYDSYIPYSFLNQTPDVQMSVSLFHKYRIDYCLNDTVEILEEENKIPEKIEQKLLAEGGLPELKLFVNKQLAELTYVINSIIDYLKSKGE